MLLSASGGIQLWISEGCFVNHNKVFDLGKPVLLGHSVTPPFGKSLGCYMATDVTE